MTVAWPTSCTSRRSEIVEMGVPPGNHPAVPRDSNLRRTCQYVARFETRGRPTSGSSSLRLGEKDGQIRGRSRWLVHNAG